jgi:hypothetical protein
MSENKPDFRFDYKKYESKQLTVEKLDKIFESIVAENPSTFGLIVSLFKMGVFALYLWTRMRLINEKRIIQKQEYERERGSSQRGDIAQDDLD